jgi:hypothetical protein
MNFSYPSPGPAGPAVSALMLPAGTPGMMLTPGGNNAAAPGLMLTPGVNGPGGGSDGGGGSLALPPPPPPAPASWDMCGTEFAVSQMAEALERVGPSGRFSHAHPTYFESSSRELHGTL